VKTNFDFYQIAGVITPGVLLIFGGAILFFPDQGENLKIISNLSVGSLGISFVLAYAVGQLLQVIGNIIENVWWYFLKGMPTDWLRTNSRKLLSEIQRQQVEALVGLMLSNAQFSFNSVDKRQWYAITRQIYSVVKKISDPLRIDIFNGNYGMCRGISAALLILFCMQVMIDLEVIKIIFVLMLFFLAIYRMHRFGVNYARELFVQYLNTQFVKKEE